MLHFQMSPEDTCLATHAAFKPPVALASSNAAFICGPNTSSASALGESKKKPESGTTLKRRRVAGAIRVASESPIVSA
jgi:hypothetical protein